MRPKDMRLTGALTFLASLILILSAPTTFAAIREDKIIREVAPQTLHDLFAKWDWQNRENFGGSFPGWAYPGSYKGCQFFVQGGKAAQAKFQIRIQRHPHLTQELVDWANQQRLKHKNLLIYAEKTFGFEVGFRFDLGAGMPESKFKKQLSQLLDTALPIVKHLNGGKFGG